ncbi:hypothetical protein AYK26_00085 [Euryarchaeota archaeon SM23-78]|nr:MAG: hypothetical protein AYK26_00085 [Euryarchaeota archaeon SM23-78]MBW3000524.1 hypothetical protein [Candidatus Woesearchaeota archaeon]
MNTEPLQKIGLTHGEIKVYLALFHLGTSTAGPIAKEARVARSKLYDILDRLSKKGVVSHSIKNGTKYFSVAEPSRLLDFLRKKEEDIKIQQQEIKKILPQLEQEYELQKVKQEAEVFEGLEGLKNIREQYLKIMKKGDEIYFFGVPSSAYHRMEAYYSDWNERRIKKGIKSYTVFTEEAKNHSYVKEKLKHKDTFIRFLPKGILTHAWIEIYGDTVVIAINYKKPMSVVINNKYVADSYKQYFDLLWKTAKP